MIVNIHILKYKKSPKIFEVVFEAFMSSKISVEIGIVIIIVNIINDSIIDILNTFCESIFILFSLFNFTLLTDISC